MDVLGIDGIALAAGDDLNDCLDSEKYYSNGASISRGLVNTPVTGNAFSMFVINLQRNGARKMQMVLDGAANEIYIRTATPSSSTWTDWKKLATEVVSTTSANPSEYSFIDENGKEIEG